MKESSLFPFMLIASLCNYRLSIQITFLLNLFLNLRLRGDDKSGLEKALLYKSGKNLKIS